MAEKRLNDWANLRAIAMKCQSAGSARRAGVVFMRFITDHVVSASFRRNFFSGIAVHLGRGISAERTQIVDPVSDDVIVQREVV